MLGDVNHPALGHLLDTGNYVDGWPSVERTADLAVHVHAKFWQVALDGAEPSIDYPRLIAMLRRRSYAGWISFEYEAADGCGHRHPPRVRLFEAGPRLLGSTEASRGPQEEGQASRTSAGSIGTSSGFQVGAILLIAARNSGEVSRSRRAT